MEENLMKRRSVHGGSEKRSTDSSWDEDDVVAKAGKKRPYPENDDIKPSSPAQKDSSITKQQDDELKSAKAEMGEVREENQRLKMYLNRMMKDYQDLQMQFYDIVGQGPKKSTATTNQQEVEEEEPELVSLTLGRFSTDSKMEDKNKTSNEDAEKSKEGLSLGLDYKFEASKSDVDDESLSKQSSCHEQKEEETWAASKALKTVRSGDDESLQQNPVKKARVCVRARCDTPTMNDGCQWRKYGQKIAKGNPCPRAYYRCTVAASCPVRKQVQRCAEDMSILLTTYEGTHNHPLPMSAKAMASTTSAAASMLLSGSSSTSSNPSTVNTTLPANLHGFNFYVSENSKSKFYMPNSSLSASSSHQTITLDLTSTPSSSSSLLNRFSSAYPSTARYPSTSLSFGSSESNTVWSNGFFSYGGTHPYMKNQIAGRPQTVENSIYQLMQKSNLNPPPDTIAAATKAITADPNFQSALAAALTSIIGNNGNNGGGGSATQPPGTADGFGQMLRWDKGNGCSQAGSLMFLPPSLPFSTPKSASTSPGDTRNQSN